MPPGLADWQLKLKRAQEHFNALRQSVEGYVNSDAYGFELTEPSPGSEPGIWVSTLLIRIRESPPVDDWSLMIADTVHNSRSALDILVSQSAAVPGRTRTSFPVFVSESGFRARGLPQIRPLSPQRQALIEREQPYVNRRDDPASDPLAILADLDNASKHRVVPTVVSWLGAGAVGFSHQDIAEIRLATTGLHVEDRAPLALVIVRVIGPNPKLEVSPEKAAHVVFGEGADRATGKRVYETLIAMGRRVTKLVADFEREP